MILKINEPFAGFIPTALVKGDCPYREVYECLDKNKKKVFLYVYDDNEMPLCLRGSTIREFDTVYNLTNEMFPNHLSRGAVCRGETWLSFMIAEYFQGDSIRTVAGKLPMKDALDVVRRVLEGLKELFCYTKGGGHYNLNLDNIIITKDEDGSYRPHVVGLEHAAEPCSGRAKFDMGTLNYCCCPPETILGRFSEKTDVYAMGMVLTYLLQGTYPFDIDETMTKAEVNQVVRLNEPNLMMPDELKEFTRKALCIRACDRFRNVEDMETALAEVIDAMAETKAVGNNEKKGKTVRGRKKPGTLLVFNQDARPGRKKREEQAVPPQMLNVEMTRHVGEGFQGVAGMADLKKRLKRDFVDIVSHRELAEKFSILPPNMLFYGPPGTGKTFLSMKLAEECGMEVCSIAPSDLASIWLHGSQRLIMELFNTAIEKAKNSERGCLVLIDEFDAVVPKRTSENRDQQAGEVAEFLVQLNDCVNKNVYVIGTTNCLDRIDKAVIRKGRIDQVIYVGMPDKECRRQLFEIELQKRPHEQTIDFEKLASLTEGYTSADISYIVKETSRNAFEASLEARGRRVVKINQKMLADVISITRPSVSDADVLRYERMRDEYLNNNKNERRRIGFCY